MCLNVLVLCEPSQPKENNMQHPSVREIFNQNTYGTSQWNGTLPPEAYAKYAGCIPVKVTSGRKWKGSGYLFDIAEEWVNFRGYGMGSWRVTASIWDPVAKRVCYCTASMCEFNDELPYLSGDELKAILKQDKEDKFKKRVDETLQWCRSVKPDLSETELKAFARNVLLKRNERELVDKYLPVVVTCDVAEMVMSTIQWAMTLKTRPCQMYGRYNPGGKPYPPRRQAQTALKALAKKGLLDADGFNEAWEMCITMFGLPDVRQ